MPIGPCNIEERRRLKKMQEEFARREGRSIAGVFGAAREIKRQIGSFPGWHEFEDARRRLLSPEARGPDDAARITGSIGKGLAATEKTAATQMMRILADEADMNSVIKKGVESERRENYWHKYSDQQLIDMISARERGERTGDAIADKIFDYDQKVYQHFGERAKANGVKMGWIKDYMMRSMKDPTQGEQFFNANQKMWGKPGFTKTRSFPTIQDAIAAGLKPRTLNPERNKLAYVSAVQKATREIQHLERMESVGLAYDMSQKVPDVAEHWEKIDTPDGKSYKVSPESKQVLANTYNISSVYDTIAGPWATFAGVVKGFTGLKLAFPIFHAIHIANVDFANTIATTLYRAKNKILTGRDIQELLGSPFRVFTVPNKYGRLRDAMSGKLSKAEMEKLTDQERTDLRDLGDMGIVAHVSHERQMQWINFITRQANKIGPISKLASIGYNFITAKWFQRLWFQHVTPALKIARALDMRDTALKMNPNLYSDPKKRALEFDKINRDVEGRYGEMFYDTLLWNSMAKQFGLNTFLSLGWNLGFWRIYGDGVIDLTNNVVHMDQIRAGVSKQKEVITERMIYPAVYSAVAALVGGTASYMALGGIHDWLKDLFFPAIGKKPNGDIERVRTPFFTTEIQSMIEHYKENAGVGRDPVKGVLGGGSEYFLNKLNPMLQSIYHAFVLNKDFRGTEISDHLLDYPTKQLPEKLWYVLKDVATPIPVEPLVGDKQNLTAEQKIAGFMGFSPAPAWTGRTQLENDILTEYGAEMGRQGGKDAKLADISDAKKEYENALQTRQGVQEAKLKLKALGVSDRAIHESDKNYKTPIANRLFKSLKPEAQEQFIKEMNPEERKEFLPFMSKKAKLEYERSLPQ